MICDPIRMCELLVGLPDVNVLAVEDTIPLKVHIELRDPSRCCPDCGETGDWKERRRVELVDLAAFGRPARLVWHKHRWSCVNADCGRGSWTSQDRRIAAPRLGTTDRAGRWVTGQVGRDGRTVSEVARELDCDWHTVNDTVLAYGKALLEADTRRVGRVTALGLDETLFARFGTWRTQAWATSIVDVVTGTLLDMVEGRDSQGPIAWLEARGIDWRAHVRYGVLDLSGPYRAVFNQALSHVTQVADPFHLVKLANSKLDECRRRVQNETLGHRGRKHDPLYRARKLLVMAQARLDDQGQARMLGLLRAGDPRGEVKTAWHAKELVRSIYQIDDPDVAAGFTVQLGHDLQDESCPPEINQLGRTIIRWHAQITAWHQARVSNGPTEAVNNLVKRVKRVAFGFRRFASYRIRALLYAGRPNWDLLATVTPY
ncbi:MAG: ISL3 family transposase [Acidimicrobiia bacterium]